MRIFLYLWITTSFFFFWNSLVKPKRNIRAEEKETTFTSEWAQAQNREIGLLYYSPGMLQAACADLWPLRLSDSLACHFSFLPHILSVIWLRCYEVQSWSKRGADTYKSTTFRVNDRRYISLHYFIKELRK